MSTVLADKLGLKPVKIKCTDSDCENGLHCFLATRKMRQSGQVGPCRSCGDNPVDWARVHRRDPLDTNYTFSLMRKEFIRERLWTKPIDQKALNHARRKGKVGMRKAAVQRIRSSISQAKPSYDRRQTPMSGNVLFLAQHATASCCRWCVEEWHGIPQGRELTELEMEYLSYLVTLYVDERLPDLTEHGEKVPPMRSPHRRVRSRRRPTSKAG